MKYNTIFCLLLMMMIFFTGCNSPVYNQAEGNVADVKIRINEAVKKSNASGKAIPNLLVKNGLYVDKTPISLAKDPPWLKNRIVLRGEQLPFSYYSRAIASGGGKNVLTHYQSGLDEAQKVTMNYSGSVRGALDLLGSKSGYVFTVNGDSIYWQAFISKSFDISFMPGSSDYMMGKASGGSSISNVASGGGGSGSAAPAVVSAIIDDSAGAQYSNLKGTLSVWKDLEKTIKQLLSTNGTVIVSESTSSVTVRDKPSNIALVGRYIANLNQHLTKQVLIKVQVLDITLENDFIYGINWNAFKNMLGNSFFLNMNNGTPISISPFSGTLASHQIGTQPVGDEGQAAVTAVITALNQQGKTSLVTEPRVVCLNNQVCVMRVTRSEGYLASSQTTTLSGSATGGTVTSQLTPGNVVTGLTLYLLPKIAGDKVFLQVNADISINEGIFNISAATGETSVTKVASSAQGIIQVPTVTQKQFNQRSVIASGDTMILSGYRQIGNQANAMQVLTSQALGGKGAQERTRETIVLITPIVLKEVV
jgi:type IVB pilus formation R64 PilN family outer membrane protein